MVRVDPTRPLELLFRHLNEGVGVDLVAVDNVLIGDLVTGVAIDLEVLDAVTGLPVELVERYRSLSEVSGYTATIKVTMTARDETIVQGRIPTSDVRLRRYMLKEPSGPWP
jgi:hypothetical protein